jgi:hypothetical protein
MDLDPGNLLLYRMRGDCRLKLRRKEDAMSDINIAGSA